MQSCGEANCVSHKGNRFETLSTENGRTNNSIDIRAIGTRGTLSKI